MTLVIEIPQSRSFDLKFHEELSPDEFWELCSRNPELVVEREADGGIHIVNSFDEVLSGEDVMPGFEFDQSKLRMSKKKK